MSDLKGWYSGKYDSTKQKKAICEGGMEAGYLKYQTSLRMEMLLSGLVVITDAQWYDGLFFANMAKKDNGEFEDFISFILKGFGKNAVPFAIRRRKSYMEMFKKSFLFSSIINEELQKFIYDIYDKNQDKKEEIYSSLQSFLDFIEKELEKDGKETMRKDFYRFRIGIERLSAIDERIFVPWDERKKDHTLDEEKEDYFLEEMKKARTKLLVLLEKYAETCSFSSKDSINEIKAELNKNFPNRSIIKNTVKSLAGDLDNRQLEETFMHIFDHHYNYAIAKQHNCKYYDLYDAISNCKFDKQKNESIFLETQCFPKEIISYLGGMTWSDFSVLFYDDEVITMRNKWLEDFDKKNAKVAKKSFYSYLDYIMKKMKNLNIWIIDNSIFYRTKGTKRFVNITVDEVGRMIGGASSDYLIDSDEICLFFGDSFDNIEEGKIVRYASTNDVTVLFDTVFAPIESLIQKNKRS